MRRFAMIFSIVCLVLTALDVGAVRSQSTGEIVAWGWNIYQQCNVPAPNADFVDVAAGWDHSLGLKTDGSIVGWGRNIYYQCDVPAPNSDFISVAGGTGHSLGVKSDGSIVAWGWNSDDQCDVPAPNSDFVEADGGRFHSLGLKTDGTIVAWGDNSAGQLNVPAPNTDFVAIAAGGDQNLGLKTDGTIVAWGTNAQGQCDVPAPNADFVAIAGGYLHSLGLKSDGTIVAWGYNSDGQCNVPAPNADFIAVSGGQYHSLGLKSDGTIVVWGRNDYGQSNPPSPNADFAGVAGGGYFSLGLEELPICDVSPVFIDFGSVCIDGYKDSSFVIKNIGTGELADSVSESCDYFDIVSGDSVYSINSGDSVVVTVRFEPLTTGAAACTISTGAGCCDVICTGTGDRAPRIYTIRDVPGDQGGFINVTWDAVPGDDPVEHMFTRYTVWRAIDPSAPELTSLDPSSFLMRVSDLPPTVDKGVVRMSSAGSLKYYWKLISSIDSYYLEAYSEVVPTLFDSTAVCDEYHYVQVIAHTSDPYTFWVSPPDSGRSVDNLAPAAPLYLVGEQSYTPEGIDLSWAPNGESDFEEYAIYRGVNEDFIPGPDNLVTSTPDTLYLDTEWRWDSGFYYKVSALDVHGNESGFASLGPDMVTGDGPMPLPDASYLAQNFPNPFNPITTIAFGLKEQGYVSLRIYDAAGRLVATLVDESRSAGRYTAEWKGFDNNGSTVASGVYFYRLICGEFEETRKMILLR